MIEIRVPKDPNSKTNRAPGKTELANIRTLIIQNENMMDYFDLQLEEGQKMLAIIQERFTEQLKALECTLSELDATNRFIDMLKNQKATAQTDLNRLNGLAHPIRRCNEDVLQYIFQWAVRMDVSPLKCATRISHVCRRWRHVALQTPVLWACVDIRTDKKPANIRLFWDQMVNRFAKGIPPTVFLYLVNSVSEQEVLKSFGFRGITRIRELTIEFYSEISAKRLVDLSLEHLSVDHLTLLVEFDDEDDDFDDPDSTVVLLTLIRKFKNLSSLTIRGCGWSSFTESFHPPFLGIKTLNISDCDPPDPISLTSLSRIFPNVETLELADSSFRLDNLNDELWPMLRSLSTNRVKTMPWSHMQIPNLTSLSVTVWYSYIKDLIPIVINHPSIRHLALLDWMDNFAELFNAVSYLETLTIKCWDGIGDLSHIGLDKVGDMRVCVDQDLTSALLAKIVQNRITCTTSAANNSDAKKSSGMLRILFENPTKENLKWLDSELVSTTLESVTEMEHQGRLHRSYNLKLYSA